MTLKAMSGFYEVILVNCQHTLVCYPINESVSFLRVNLREPHVPDKANCFGISMGALAALNNIQEAMYKS